jgi:CheY-like chemotaxis protein
MNKLQRVMCVEDDADIRMILEFSLTAVGAFEVCLCASGRSALDQASTFKPDVVLLDVMMPDLTGPQTLQALRQMPVMQNVPVIFITAKALPDELEELMQYGVAGVIVKPFDPVQLPREVRTCWERAHGAAND